MYTDSLEDKIFKSPASTISDTLVVISGYIGSETVSMLRNYPDKNFIVVYGMYACDGISKALHDNLLDIQEELNKEKENWIHIKYSLVPVHSKIYCWSKDNVITEVLVGSANFSINGLRKDMKETLYPISSLGYKEYEEYKEYVLSHCIDCSVATKFKNAPTDEFAEDQPYVAQRICRISLLDSKGRVPKQSGLNWGESKAHVRKGDAYLPIKVNYIKTFPELFPQKKYVDGNINRNSKGKINRANDEVEFIWDDKHSMVGLLEGNNTIDGVIYPNKLCSSPSKKELGDYIRKRIETKLGAAVYNAESITPITKEILERYGRTHIDISRIGDGIYYLDFSV